MQRHMSEGVKENFFVCFVEGCHFFSFFSSYLQICMATKERTRTNSGSYRGRIAAEQKEETANTGRVHSQWEGPSGAGEL